MSKHLNQSRSGDWADPTKFDELRLKTEKQLIQLVNSELDHGIRDARQALKSADTLAVAEECRRRANTRHAQAARLIRLVTEIAEDERSRLESKLDCLARLLESLSPIGSTPSPAEEEIAALARAVWEARGCPEGPPEEDWYRAERALKAQRESDAACVGY